MAENVSSTSELNVPNTNQRSDGPLNYRIATEDDCESLWVLIESCFRGEVSCQGWTSEHELLGGQRIDVETLRDIINDSSNVIFMFFYLDTNDLVGCVRLQNFPETKTAYLGMLSVSPTLQNRGYGKFILSIAENYAADSWNAEKIEMTVIDLRTELLEFYQRRGYVDSGERKPFPFDDPKFGTAKRRDFEFYLLHKSMKKT